MAVPPVTGQQTGNPPTEAEVDAAFEAAVVSVMQSVAMSAIVNMSNVTNKFVQQQKENKQEE